MNKSVFASPFLYPYQPPSLSMLLTHLPPPFHHFAAALPPCSSSSPTAPLRISPRLRHDDLRSTWAPIARAQPSWSAGRAVTQELPSFTYSTPSTIDLPPALAPDSPITRDVRTVAQLNSHFGPDTPIRTMLSGIGPVRALNLPTGHPNPYPHSLTSMAIAPSSLLTETPFSQCRPSSASCKSSSHRQNPLAARRHPVCQPLSLCVLLICRPSEPPRCHLIRPCSLPGLHVINSPLLAVAPTPPYRAAAGEHCRLLRHSAALLNPGTRAFVSRRARA